MVEGSCDRQTGQKDYKMVLENDMLFKEKGQRTQKTTVRLPVAIRHEAR